MSSFFRAGKAQPSSGQTETNQAAQPEADFSSKSLTKGLAKLDSKQPVSSTVARNLEGSKPERIVDPDRPSSNDSNKTITEQSREENVTKQSVQDFFQKLEAIQVDQPISQLEVYNEYNDEQLTEECKDNGSLRPQTQLRAPSALPSSTRHSVNLIMAFNDLRRANAKMFETAFDESPGKKESHEELTAQ